MNESGSAFVNIIRGSMGLPYELPDAVDWALMWETARRHHLEVLVCTRFRDELPEEIRQNAVRVCTVLQGVALQQDYTLKQIEERLTQAGISYAPLKGAVIRGDYADPCSRYMSDLDFYIRPEDRAAIRNALEAAGGAYAGSESGDDKFRMNGRAGAEFHGRLLYRRADGGIINYPAWEFVDTETNRLTEEGFALNLIGHAVGDLLKGGPGVRYILDIWVLRHRHAPQPDWDAVYARMKEDGIYEAAKNLLDLSEYLFGDGEQTPLMEEMAEYVLKGGLHGDSRRGILAGSRDGKMRAVFKQVFRNREEFENRYPWLKKRPYLLPAAWVMRLCTSVRRHKKEMNDWSRRVGGVTKSEIEEQKAALKRFGL